MANFMDRLGRGLYAVSGDINEYDKLKQDADSARAKAAQQQLEMQMKQAEFIQKAQEQGYQPIKDYAAQTYKGGDQTDLLPIPGVGMYARTFADKVKLNKLKEEAAIAYSTTGATMNQATAAALGFGGGVPTAPDATQPAPMIGVQPGSSIGANGRYNAPAMMRSAVIGDNAVSAALGSDYYMKNQLTHVRGIPVVQQVPTLTPQAEGRNAGVVEGGKILGKEQADANVSIARDNAQLGQMAQSLKNLYALHTDLTKSGLAGDAYASLKGKNIDKIPAFMQNIVANPADQEKLGQFVSARNETMTKMQPMLSQQFGQAGSVRIMDSLLQLSGKELPDLGTPNAMAKGQVKGTLRTMFVIGKAGEKYAEELAKRGQSLNGMSEEDYIKGVQPYISKVQGSLTKEQEKELKAITDEVLGSNVPSGHTQAQTQSGVTFSYKKIGK